MADVRFMRCRPEHLWGIETQVRDDSKTDWVFDPDHSRILAAGFSLSAWVDGICIGAAGLVRIHDQRALGWALLSNTSGPYMRQITRKCIAALDVVSFRRVEMCVETDFELGHRWAKMMGFAVEAPCMKVSGVSGKDETMYARVR